MVAGVARSNDFPLSSTTSDVSVYAHFSTVVDSPKCKFLRLLIVIPYATHAAACNTRQGGPR